jgi:hypothetical protein
VKRSRFVATGQTDISSDEVLRWLERIFVSQLFFRSYRLSQFLRFVVERSLSGRRDQIKEYTIGTEVYGRNSDFDPSVDSIVRVEARRLRKKLTTYYEGEGASDEIVISFRPGTYIPSYERGSVSRLTAKSEILQNSSRDEVGASCVNTGEPKLSVDQGFRIEGDRLYITVEMVARSSTVSWSQRFEAPTGRLVQMNISRASYSK